MNCTDRNKVGRNHLIVIDNDVYSANSMVALSKNQFALNILNQADGFENVDIKEFRLVFNMIEKILAENPIL